MTTTTITQNKTIIEIMVVHDGNFYFLNRLRPVSEGPLRISAERAAEIIQLNEEEAGIEISTRGEGPVEIGSQHSWSWIAKITMINEEEPE